MQFIDLKVLIYKPIFSRCPNELDDKHIQNVNTLLDNRPTKMFCLFSQLVRSVVKHESDWSMVDLLYHVHKSVMNISGAKFLLSLFYYLLKNSKKYDKIYEVYTKAFSHTEDILKELEKIS